MAVLSVLAGVAIALVASGPSDLSPKPQEGAPIWVVSSSHEVDFPDEVVFRLEAESEANITEVRLFYRLARSRIQVYGYPDFTPATEVSADFSLSTDGAGYIPSGVGIEYHYEISDAAGNTFETERYSLEYRDPRFDWQVSRQGELEVLSHDISLDRVQGVAASVVQRLDEIKDAYGLGGLPPMKAVILNSRREAANGFPFISEAASQGHLYGGFAFRDYDLFVLAGLNEDAMVHEGAHLLMAEAVGSPLARVPAWLNEGLATYFESNSSGRQSTAERAVRSGSFLSLGSMNAVPGQPAQVILFYAQSWSVVRHMVETYGTGHMASLLRAINTGSNVDEAVSDVYGLSLDELESEWKSEFAQETSLVPRPDPGTVAVPTLIGGALAVALVVSAWRWLVYRTKRPEAEDLVD